MSNDALLELDIPELTKVKSGKVREVFDLGEHYLFVASDRISAFDVIMPNGIPRKGEVLTQISHFWFDKYADLVPNHRVADGLPEDLGHITGRHRTAASRLHFFGQEDPAIAAEHTRQLSLARCQ